MKNGSGTYYSKDGESYKGTWQNNMKHGSGLCVMANGTKIHCVWKNDKLIRYKKL